MLYGVDLHIIFRRANIKNELTTYAINSLLKVVNILVF